jgi:ketosteroid isomerase-like protein
VRGAPATPRGESTWSNGWSCPHLLSRSGVPRPNHSPAAEVHRVPGRQKLSDPRDSVDAMPNHHPATTPNDLGRFFLERANAGDVEGRVALYEPDAVLAFPAGEFATGHAEIRAVYRTLLADRPTFEPGTQQDSLVAGDLALTSTRLPNGAATVEIAHRQPDGTWLWAVDQPNILA